MIYNRKNAFIYWFMQAYARWAVGSHFHQLVYNTVTVDQNKSVLLIANHFSFWDGLILYVINHRLLKKKFHVMILEDTVRKSAFLKYAGAFSIAKNSKEMLHSLDYAAKLLQKPGNMVLIFPQGKLYSNFVSYIYFEQGIMRILKKAGTQVQYLFAATFIQYMNHKKPTATVYLTHQLSRYATLGELQGDYQQHYDWAKLQQTQIVL